MVDDHKAFDRLLVELQIDYPRGIGTPPIAAEVAASVDLFLINPVEDSVEEIIVAVGRQLALALCRRVDDIEIVVAHKGNEAAVGAERRFLLFARRRSQTGHRVGVERVKIEIVADGEHDALLVGAEVPSALLRELFRVVIADSGDLLRCGLQLRRIEQRALLAGLRVDHRLFEDGAFLVPARPGEGAVIEPHEARLRRAGEVDASLGVVNVLDGQLAHGRLRGCVLHLLRDGGSC